MRYVWSRQNKKALVHVTEFQQPICSNTLSVRLLKIGSQPPPDLELCPVCVKKVERQRRRKGPS